MTSTTPKLYIEIVKERIIPGPRGITSSTLRDATDLDIEAAKRAHETDRPHEDEKTTVLYDEAGWMYDMRRCGICGETIAMI